MNIVWIKSGIAIHTIVSGYPTIISPLKENKSTNVARSAAILTCVSLYRNFVLNHAKPLDLIIHFREKYPATNGNATYIVTESNIVCHGIGIPFTPSNKLPRGAYSTSIVREFMATITKVSPSLPFAR